MGRTRGRNLIKAEGTEGRDVQLRVVSADGYKIIDNTISQVRK